VIKRKKHVIARNDERERGVTKQSPRSKEIASLPSVARNDDNVAALLSVYKKRKNIIKKRLLEFKKMRGAGKNKLFAELCFCLCTPQSKAVNCNEAVRRLEKTGDIFSGREKIIANQLKGLVRFHNNKARYIVEAREKFLKNPKLTREWLVKNIKGLGLKEASHFLRNIGMGENLAIIDRHILTNLAKYGAIYNIPESISNKQYLVIEETMRRFSKNIGIPLAELDLLFWSNQTGHVFK